MSTSSIRPASAPDYGARGVLGRSVSIIGILAVSIAAVIQYLNSQLVLWALVLTLAACVAWLLLVIVRINGPVASIVLVGLMVVPGTIAAAASGGTALIVAAVGVLWLSRDLRRPICWGAVLGLVAMALTIAGDLIVPVPSLAIITMEVGIVAAFLGGESRRQFLVASVRARELVEEQARAEVLSSRAQLAHDIHDVLAHSLGGLVIQLDAVDALLEAGDADAASAKIRDARRLAADGLGEARRAVAALSEPDVASESRVPGARVYRDVASLVTAHGSFGGSASLVENGHRESVSDGLAAALRRAAQEGLTNARKHAPGEPVTVTLCWRPDGVSLTISNPVRMVAHAEGGGHGLVGMRERFSALPGGRVESGVEGGRFVVTASAATA